MTPEELARIHAAAFLQSRVWSAKEIAALCDSVHVHLYTRAHGFALVRTIADESELLTLAVDPEHHRKGIATGILLDWLDTCSAAKAYLEVAADNVGAQALYTKYGFKIAGRRKGYYARKDAASVDAVLMQRAIASRHAG